MLKKSIFSVHSRVFRIEADDNAVRPVYTEIDRVFLLCNACEHGLCEIDYWIRGEENVTGCAKCPQWVCPSRGHCGGTSADKLPPSPYSGFAVPVVPSPYSGFAAPVVSASLSGVPPGDSGADAGFDSESLVLALTRTQHNNNGGNYV